MTYVDHAASGRAFAPIEAFIQSAVLPTYGNVHSETSFVGAQTMAFREEARHIIHEAVGGGSEDVVIFTGSGTTGAVAKLIACLGLSLPCKLDDQYDLASYIPEDERPVVFVGPFEHHSNELPWRESIAEVVVVDACHETGIDLDDLDRKLQLYADRPIKIGSFSAASNVTGTLTDVRALARLLHNHGALAFFDYAAAGPVVDVEMCSSTDPLAYKDAVFLSTHKFVGGPGTPGILIAKKHLFDNRVPAVPGGGTVSYASPRTHWYLEDIQHREEGGTPDIVGSIRAGLCWKLKQACARAGGTEVQSLAARELQVAREVIAAWRAEPNLVLLGDLDAPRLSTVSFMVRCGQRALHHGFVVALLNDLFGIQARGGCSCAAPFGHRLLGLDEAAAAQLEPWIKAGWNGVRPGWIRVSFGWYDSEATLQFVVDAVRFVAREGWRFLPDYTFDARGSTWRHRGPRPALRGLAGALAGALGESSAPVVLPEEARSDYLAEATALAMAARVPMAVEPVPFEELRWFWLPGEMPK
jgi:selenocysteine lyase/cysteine desulfurase